MSTTRQRINPAVKAQAALDIADRKLVNLDKRIAQAKEALSELQSERPALLAARDYAAANPALPTVQNVSEVQS